MHGLGSQGRGQKGGAFLSVAQRPRLSNALEISTIQHVQVDVIISVLDTFRRKPLYKWSYQLLTASNHRTIQRLCHGCRTAHIVPSLLINYLSSSSGRRHNLSDIVHPSPQVTVTRTIRVPNPIVECLHHGAQSSRGVTSTWSPQRRRHANPCGTRPLGRPQGLPIQSNQRCRDRVRCKQGRCAERLFHASNLLSQPNHLSPVRGEFGRSKRGSFII